MKTFAVLTLTLPLSFASNCFAQQKTFTADPVSCRVGFVLSATGHEVHGVFHVQSGTIQFDRSTAKISGSILVSAASGESGDKDRDKKMRSEVLEVEHFADIIFVRKVTWAALRPRATRPCRSQESSRCVVRHTTSPFRCRSTSMAPGSRPRASSSSRTSSGD